MSLVAVYKQITKHQKVAPAGLVCKGQRVFASLPQCNCSKLEAFL